MKNLTSNKWLLLVLVLASLPLLQGCDDDEGDGYSGTRTPNAWLPAEFRGFPTLFGGAGSAGGSGTGTGAGAGSGSGNGTGTAPQ